MGSGRRRGRGRRSPAAAARTGAASEPLGGWRRWVYPLVTATLLPALLLGGLEVGLRLGGFGFPGSFFLPIEGREGVLTTNRRFGWRFFPPRLAREPVVCELAAEKPAETVRVFVLGGSAAMGTPEPAFGLARVLGVMLEEAWPRARFEVVNAAMAAVNSHVVRVIAGDSARREPDLFVVYLGNNEVVGPYGPGSVFGRFSPGLGYTRAAIAVRGTRTGQLLQRPADWLARRPSDGAGAAGGADGPAGEGGSVPARWRGMEMFLDYRIAADDSRLEAVYEQLGRNLEDVIGSAAGTGAPVVLSTVAVNLAESPPFASLHRPDLDEAEGEAWRVAVDRGDAELEAGRSEAAVEAYREALAIDDRHAGLHFSLGSTLLELNRTDEARHHLERARDLDVLRFRADGRVNETIRQVAAAAVEAGRALHLVDAAEELSGDGAAAEALFYEHVHLRFEGNHRLARLIYDRAASLLAERLGPSEAPPSASRCAERLGLTDLDRLRMAETIAGMTGRPPFTFQRDHEARHAARRHEVRFLRGRRAGKVGETLSAKRRALEGAAERGSDDLSLREGLAASLEEAGRPAEAAEEWRRLVERVPGVAAWRTRLGFALADAGRLDEAVAELRRAVELSADRADARANLGTVLERRGELAAAEALYRRALAEDPSSTAARLNLARLLERRGRFGEALTEYRTAQEMDPGSATPPRRLAEAYDRRGMLEEAAAAYRDALRLDPDSAPSYNNLGWALERLGRPEEPAAAYAAATAADAGYALAWFNRADLLLAHGRPAEAAAAYRNGLALEPDNDQARANLEQALRMTGAGKVGGGTGR